MSVNFRHSVGLCMVACTLHKNINKSDRSDISELGILFQLCLVSFQLNLKISSMPLTVFELVEDVLSLEGP